MIIAHRLLYILLLFSLYSGAQASEVIKELEVKPGISARAHFIEGSETKPVILVLHGFLSTGDHSTIINIKDTLVENGYGVLVPTLTLGIDRRKQSLPCEAIHSHTMSEDVAEIDRWVEWLTSSYRRPVILLGHSFGSLQLLVFMSQHKNPLVKALVATSLIDLEHAVGKENVKAQLDRANKYIRQGNINLQNYKISYCKKFVATAGTFTSYARWDKRQILDLLKDTPVSVYVIMGGGDKRMSVDWPARLKHSGAKVSVIENANHFFSNEHEFELQDRVLSIMEKL